MPAGSAIGAASAQRTRKLIVGVTVAMHLLLLSTFKYLDFLVGSANHLLHAFGAGRELPFMEIILPVGISFFTFHGISYLVDVYRGDVAVCRRPARHPAVHVVLPAAGRRPDRARRRIFLPQLARPPARARCRSPQPVLLILGGLFKKVVIATYLATDLVDPVFFDPSQLSAAPTCCSRPMATRCRSIATSRAYTDMAIGLAALLGYPLSAQLRPALPRAERCASSGGAGTSRCRSGCATISTSRSAATAAAAGSTYRNLMITMLLGGLWHGAAWKFVVWGALHGGGLVVERLAGSRGPAPGAQTRGGACVAVLIVFHFVCLGWILFRADSFDTRGRSIWPRWCTGRTPRRRPTPFTIALIVLGLAHCTPCRAMCRDGWPRCSASVRRGSGVSPPASPSR